MLIIIYFTLIGIFIGSLILRKKFMEATVGAIHRGALTLNNRVDDWKNRQIMENPNSPVAKWRYARQWNRMEARRNIYNKLRDKRDRKNGQEKEDILQNQTRNKKGHSDNAGTPSDNRKNNDTTGNISEGAKRNINHTREKEPKTLDPEEAKTLDAEKATEAIQTPVNGLEQMPENARESFDWRSAPDDQTGSQVEDDLEVFGPWDKIPQEAREPVKYNVVTEDGKNENIYGSWEETPHGPVLRENYWSLERTRRAYRIMRDKQGNVFARKFNVDDAKEKGGQKAKKQAAPQTPQNSPPPESTAVPGESAGSEYRNVSAPRQGPPLAGHGSSEKTTATREKAVRQKPTQRGRGPVDFGARYSPGVHPPGEPSKKTVNATGNVKEEKNEDMANPNRHDDQPPIIENSSRSEGSSAGKQ
ncbi:hypothetical protein [Desulfoscipio gibsoniae]